MSVTSRPVSMPLLSSRPASAAWSHTQTGRRKSSRNLTPTGNQFSSESSQTERGKCGMITDFATLAEHTYFKKHQALYLGRHSILGAIVCQIAIQGNLMHAHVLSRAGSMAITDLGMSACISSEVTPLGSHTAKITRALTALLLEYIRWIPKSTTLMLERSATSSFASSDSLVTQIVSCLEVSKDGNIELPLREFLIAKYSRSVCVDVILSPDSILKTVLPPEIALEGLKSEGNNEPVVARIENIEKQENLMHEILMTEKTYVSRIQHLLKDYAAPLRESARRPKSVLGTYETNALFPTCLDAIGLLNQDFLLRLQASSGAYEFAIVLCNGFKDFHKIYTRYLEASADLDNTLRNALKSPKFKEFTDSVRFEANANIGIRELVMEPISRIPRYSLLISSLLAAMSPMNSAYAVLKEALALVKRIGNMERDKQELNQEAVIRFAALVSSWPSELVKSSVHVLSYVDCQDLAFPVVKTLGNTATFNEGMPCSLLLFADRLVILKRNNNSRIQDVLQNSKKGELGYRGYALLSTVKIIEGEDCLYLLFESELTGVNSDRWIGRPFRKFALLSSDALRFADQVIKAQSELKNCQSLLKLQSIQECRLLYAVYDSHGWAAEKKSLQCPIRIWEDIDDGDMTAYNLIISEQKQEKSYSCYVRHGTKKERLCADAPLNKIRDVVAGHIMCLQRQSWLSAPFYSEEGLMATYDMCASAIFSQAFNQASSILKVRPTSPAKIMSSFLGRRDKQMSPSNGRPASYAGTTGASPIRSFDGHTITKKKSGQLFNFGTDSRSLTGIDTFVEAVVSFEFFPESDFVSLTSLEQKQVSTLVNLFTKDTSKSFAIIGSPSKVALHAFRVYCTSMSAKCFPGSNVLPDATFDDLRSHLLHDVELRRGRLRATIAALQKSRSDVLKTVLRCGIHILSSSLESCRVQVLLLLSGILVSSLRVSSFLSVLEVLLEDFDRLFDSPRQFDVGTMSSITSGMSLRPMNSYLGSMSSISDSRYGTEPGTLTTANRSPAKHSEFGSTPELMNGTSSMEDGASMAWSRSVGSVLHSPVSELDGAFKSSEESIKKFDNQNIFGLTASESHLPKLISTKDKKLPDTPDDLSEAGYSNVSMMPEDTFHVDRNAMHCRDRSPARSLLPEPQAPYVMDDLTSARGVVLSHARSADTLDTKRQGFARRSITPSRIPVRSPRLDVVPDPVRTGSGDWQSNDNKVYSRKGSGIPRLPSQLVRRRDSHGIMKSFSSHSFTFDDLSGDLGAALRFSTSDIEHDLVSPMTGLTGFDTPVNEDSAATELPEGRHSLEAQDSPGEAAIEVSRAFIRDQIGSEHRRTSTSTVRRVSRQLEQTRIGPLDIPFSSFSAAAPSMPISANCSPSIESRPSLAMKMSHSEVRGCTAACKEHFELLRLELAHYQSLYRDAVEEVDATLDLANEQIEQLQNAVEDGSLEATLLGILELEKEKNRKCMMEIAMLRGSQT